jgi:predicted ATPase
VLQQGIKAGHSAEDLRAEPIAWQQKMLRQDFALFDGLPSESWVFCDTSFIETLVFSARAGMELGSDLRGWLSRRRYHKVFFLSPLEDYEQSAVRMESQRLATQLSVEIQAAYQALGYELIPVPAAPLAERLNFVLSALSLAPRSKG